jgi:glutathione S-transferase
VQTYRDLLGDIEQLAQKASPWLGGDKPGVLDAYALTLLRWGGYAGIDPATMPATWALAQRFAALPPVARAVERERLELNVYKG